LPALFFGKLFAHVRVDQVIFLRLKPFVQGAVGAALLLHSVPFILGKGPKKVAS
jgi:hypothetical protein